MHLCASPAGAALLGRHTRHHLRLSSVDTGKPKQWQPPYLKYKNFFWGAPEAVSESRSCYFLLTLDSFATPDSICDLIYSEGSIQELLNCFICIPLSKRNQSKYGNAKMSRNGELEFFYFTFVTMGNIVVEQNWTF